MDKKKQMIEKMAKDLYGHICGKVKCQECKYHGDSEILEPYCSNYLRAKHLINPNSHSIVFSSRFFSELIFQRSVLNLFQEIAGEDVSILSRRGIICGFPHI